MSLHENPIENNNESVSINKFNDFVDSLKFELFADSDKELIKKLVQSYKNLREYGNPTEDMLQSNAKQVLIVPSIKKQWETFNSNSKIDDPQNLSEQKPQDNIEKPKSINEEVFGEISLSDDHALQVSTIEKVIKTGKATKVIEGIYLLQHPTNKDISYILPDLNYIKTIAQQLNDNEKASWFKKKLNELNKGKTNFSGQAAYFGEAWQELIASAQKGEVLQYVPVGLYDVKNKKQVLAPALLSEIDQNPVIQPVEETAVVDVSIVQPPQIVTSQEPEAPAKKNPEEIHKELVEKYLKQFNELIKHEVDAGKTDVEAYTIGINKCKELQQINNDNLSKLPKLSEEVKKIESELLALKKVEETYNAVISKLQEKQESQEIKIKTPEETYAEFMNVYEAFENSEDAKKLLKPEVWVLVLKTIKNTKKNFEDWLSKCDDHEHPNYKNIQTGLEVLKKIEEEYNNKFNNTAPNVSVNAPVPPEQPPLIPIFPTVPPGGLEKKDKAPIFKTGDRVKLQISSGKFYPDGGEPLALEVKTIIPIKDKDGVVVRNEYLVDKKEGPTLGISQVPEADLVLATNEEINKSDTINTSPEIMKYKNITEFFDAEAATFEKIGKCKEKKEIIALLAELLNKQIDAFGDAALSVAEFNKAAVTHYKSIEAAKKA